MIKALILDLDGTVYLDGNPIKNVVELLNKHHSEGVFIQFLTNNTSVSKIQYVHKLRQLSLNFVSAEHVITPLDAFLNYAEEVSVRSCYYLLPEEVILYLEQVGGPKMNSEDPDIVLIGFDKDLTYQKLQRSCELINSGISYSITHIDLACPSENGPIPDCGSIARLVESTTDKKWGMHFGKPSKKLGDIILKNLNRRRISIENTVLVGDRYYTDIALGNEIGMLTCHVQTGEINELKSNAPAHYRPTYEYSDLCEFIQDHLEC
tara:strand:- start:337978 stop:338769 length:792 start_codon:yes stop_codon:yes gene_type:complete